MDRQECEAIAFNICQQLSSETREKLFDAQTATNLARYIVAEELESWQYCYIESDDYTNPLMPAYVAKSFTVDELEQFAEQFIGGQDPFQSLETPTQRDARMVAASGGSESYCESQLELYTTSCVETFVSFLNQALDGACELDEEETRTLAEHIVNAVDIWKWYILTLQAREHTKSSGRRVGELVISNCQAELPYLIDLLFDTEVDRDVLADNIVEFDDDKNVSVDLIHYAETNGLED